MKEEIRKILEMLENGKTNPEQAEKLINAMDRFVMNVISITFKAVGEGLKFVPFVPSEISKVFLEASKVLNEDFENLDKDLYIVKAFSDDVVISTSPDSQLKPGRYNQNTLVIPENSKLALKVFNGNAKLSGKFNEVKCVVIDGDLEFEGWFNLLGLFIISGDAGIKTDIRDLRESVRLIDGEKDIPELPGGNREINGTIIDGKLKIISSD